MFEPLDNLVANAIGTTTVTPRFMTEVVDLLAREIAEGQAASPRKRTNVALRSLLKLHNLTPESAPLDPDWFKGTFPIDGWNPGTMPKLSQASYLDYRKRALAAVERTCGITQKRTAARRTEDDWTVLSAWLETLPEFQGLGERRLIPIRSTLTIGARLAGLQPADISQGKLKKLHDTTRDSGTRESYRNAARLIAELQAAPGRSVIWEWIGAPISRIVPEVRNGYDISQHFADEIERMVEIAAQKRFVAIKNQWEYVAEKTQDNYRSTLRALVAALVSTGNLDPDTGDLRSAFEDDAARTAALREWLDWFEGGRWAEKTVIRHVNRLPCILRRNGIDTVNLEKTIQEVDEFRDTVDKRGMSEASKTFCRALIERPAYRSDFLLSHIPPRRAAERILKAAKSQKRDLKPSEIVAIRQFAIVALFCAIECGGAPIRLDNFLKMSCTGSEAWLKTIDKDTFEFVIPPGCTKNRKRIWARIQASREKYHDTVRWYLQIVRPLILKDWNTGRLGASLYLVPAVTDPERPLPDATFREWFSKIMRNEVGVVCTPHNFRHGQASLLYHANPGLIGMIARRLGDTEQTVLETYAWVHKEQEAERGQETLVGLLTKGGRK